jgi:uncharacterized membrane protein YphA (DoxX/SURF4 family)
MSYPVEALSQPHIQLFLRLVLGGVLLLAGVSKLADRAAFRQAVAEYEVLPASLARSFAAIVPWVETALGVLLLVGFGTGVAAGIAVPLFLSFAFAIGVNLQRGREFDCHCFGAVQADPIGATSLLRALIFASIALVVALGASRFGSLEYALWGSTADLPPTSEVIPVVFIAGVVFDAMLLLPEAAAFRAIFSQRQRTQITGHNRHTNGHRPTAHIDESTIEMERSA